MEKGTEETMYEDRLSLSSSTDDTSQGDNAGLLSGRRRAAKNNKRIVVYCAAVAMLWISSLILVMKITQGHCPRDGFAYGFDTDLGK